jgi:hypothetical protein
MAHPRHDPRVTQPTQITSTDIVFPHGIPRIDSRMSSRQAGFTNGDRDGRMDVGHLPPTTHFVAVLASAEFHGCRANGWAVHFNFQSVAIPELMGSRLAVQSRIHDGQIDEIL